MMAQLKIIVIPVYMKMVATTEKSGIIFIHLFNGSMVFCEAF
jgi:hypothetical protein